MSLSVSRSAFLLGVALWLASTGASADVTKDECVDANSKAQLLRREAKLSAARVQLQICVDTRCPRIVSDDCTRRLEELERAQPTIVFDAKDAAGNDVSDVRVSVDGRPLAERLDGAALTVDPGDHEFTFEIVAQPTVTRRFVLHEGEKARRERVVVGASIARPVATATARLQPAPQPPAPVEASPPSPPSPPAEGGGGGRKTLGVVMGGVGIAGIGVGSVFGLLAISSWNHSQTDCHRPATLENCPNHDQAVTEQGTAVSDGAISTIGFIAGGSLLAGGIALWLMAPSEASASPAPALAIRVSPSLSSGMAGIAVKGEF
jgi:hypothetical protein